MVTTAHTQNVSSAFDAYEGLSSAQVTTCIQQGLCNTNSDIKTKSISQIVATHALTLFNVVNIVLAILVLTTGQFRNILFMVIVFLNLVIGISQEIRAKLLVDKLSIVSAKKVRVIRDHTQQSIHINDIVLGDFVLLSRGEQAPADGSVIAGAASMDESLLTGESNPIEKTEGAPIYSGSFVDSGSMLYKVEHVAGDCYAAKINNAAKYVKPLSSEIVITIKTIISYATMVLIPLGILLFIRMFCIDHQSYIDAILQAVAATVGMIPQGLVLLTSTIFAIATTKLAYKHVLVQQSYCVETLARVDVVCLDKTGTITTGHMRVTRVIDATGSDDEAHTRPLCRAVSAISFATRDAANETARALIDFVDIASFSSADIARSIPFSSRTKYSGCITTDGHAYVMGAPQFVLGARADNYNSAIESFAAMTRVLVVAECAGFDDHGHIVYTCDDARDGACNHASEDGVRVLGFVGIAEEIRESAPSTIAYFKQEGVDVRVISGDDPRSVSQIAQTVGVVDADKYIDCSSLEGDEAIADAALHYHVFGRVTPQIKQRLVTALKHQGHIVAMTGDGVNDILALKEADCSIAMAQGSAAARNVSELVLADNDFSHIPDIVVEGRRSINNLQRSAALFLTKTVYSGLLALICLLCPPYPFIPIQMSLINVAAIGLPSFLLALEVNRARVEGSFLAHVLVRSIPASIVIVAQLVFTMLYGRACAIPDSSISTLCMIEMSCVGIALILRISTPLNVLRSCVLFFSIAIVIIGYTCLSDFLRMGALTSSMMMLCAAISLVGVVLFFVFYAYAEKHYPLLAALSLKKR